MDGFLAFIYQPFLHERAETELRAEWQRFEAQRFVGDMGVKAGERTAATGHLY